MTQENIEKFLARFYSFNDAVIVKIDIKFRHLSLPTVINVLLSTRDAESNVENEWVNVSLTVKDVTAFRFMESTKASFQVLSDGIHIAILDESIFIDFGDFDELPTDFNELESSRYFVKGRDFKWVILPYEE